MNLLFLEMAEKSSKVVQKTQNNTSYFAYSFILTILFIINIYFLIKFFIGFKRSIDKTKKILGEFLVKKHIQGFNIKNNAFFNIIIISLLIMTQIVFSAVVFVKVRQNNETSFKTLFALGFTTGSILALSFLIFTLILYKIKFNYPQYNKKSESEIFSEIISLKESKNKTLNLNFPKKININYDNLKGSNILLANLLVKWISNYNSLEEKEFKKQYHIFLNQLFKINYFEEVVNKISNNEFKTAQTLISDSVSIDESMNLDKIEKEILWMDKVDKKAKIINETKDLSKLSKEEFNKKYEEYVYESRINDPIYQSTSKNSWLFYRDSETEDLFFNTSSLISYTIDDLEVVYEKELLEFLKDYKEFLISKFLLTKSI
ncbi:hypothetical protein [Metamycoplasma canadense]|uniref:Uncharacterized protein n=1 Tax=Metamycoplasma canadense TaxID=29554 RepID=A0A077L5Y9_9BACT|nr:hypothetical protein [Metamycoplasma canadense]BAP39705.1 hypothetical protein MCAN360_0629 [Metamycoplasma canadense]